VKIIGTVQKTEIPAKLTGTGAPTAADVLEIIAALEAAAAGSYIHVEYDTEKQTGNKRNWFRKNGYEAMTRNRTHLYVGRNGTS
jgi:hypothetical protein